MVCLRNIFTNTLHTGDNDDDDNNNNNIKKEAEKFLKYKHVSM